MSAIRDTGDGAEVTWHDGGRSHTVTGRHVLANVAPWVLRILLGDGEDPDGKPEGSQLKINLLLDRLPQLKSGVDPAVAFAGTLHLARGLQPARGGVRRRGRRADAREAARRGLLPLADRPVDPG